MPKSPEKTAEPKPQGGSVRRVQVARARDVARLANLSRSQVSNYFNNPDLVSAASKERIRSAIDDLGYVRNESARQLRVGSSNMLGLLLLDAWLPYFAEISRGVEDEAERRGWHLQFANSARDENRELRHLDFFQARQLQGIIIVPQGDVSDRLRHLADKGIACVLLDPPHHHPVPLSVPSIAVDHIAGGALAADHLVQRGGRQFAFVGHPRRSGHSADRLAGFQSKINTSPSHDQVRVFETDDLTFGDGTQAASQILALPRAEWPDAVLAANDLTAFGLMHALSSHGVAVPGDVRIVGYDDIALAVQLATPLTTIRQPAALLGRLAADMVIEQIEGRSEQPLHRLLQPELVVRASS